MNGIKTQKYSSWIVAAFSFAFILCAANSQAGTINANSVPTITVDDLGFDGPAWTYTPALDDLMDLPERGKKLGVPTAIMKIQGNRADVKIEQLEFDPDPFVVNNFLITNNTAATLTYLVTVSLPTSFPGPNFISGNVRTDAQDSGGAAGATVATDPAFPIYTALKDGVSVATLQNHPFSVVAPPTSTASSAASFGPLVHAAPIVANMGIQLRFTVTAGDTASILSRFDVVAIPEPASLALGIFAVVACVSTSGRRR